MSAVNPAVPPTNGPPVSAEIRDNFATIKTELEALETGKADTSHTHTQAQVTGLVTDLAAKAPLASPTFTGTVTLPAGQVVNGVTLTTGGGTTNFLRADGTYAAPPGGGGASWGSITGTLSAQTDLQTALDAKLDDSQATAFGLSLLDDANASAARTTLGLATVASSGSAADLSGVLPAASFNDTTHGNRGGGSLHATATTSVAGFMSAADKTKLDGVATGATANSSDATLLNRANHTGTQAQSTIVLADDLAALEALTGTNHIYYRSGVSTWTQVTIGANLTFTSGTLAATGGGGGISASELYARQVQFFYGNHL